MVLRRCSWFYAMVVLALVVILAAPAYAQDESPGGEAFTVLTYGDGVLALLYPTGWALDEQALDTNTLLFFSGEAMVGRPADAPYAPGEASLALTLIPTADLARYRLPADSVQRALLGIISSLRAAESDDQGGSRLSWTLPVLHPAVDGRPEVAQAFVSLPGEVDRELYLWAVSEDLWALLAASTAPGEGSTVADFAQVMLQSLQFDGTVEALRSGAAETEDAS